ncbi:hypothetical protein NKG05_19235 [Oerskovia sp. M15]
MQVRYADPWAEHVLGLLAQRRRWAHPMSTLFSARHWRVPVASTRSVAVRSKIMGWKASRVPRIPPSIRSWAPH